MCSASLWLLHASNWIFLQVHLAGETKETSKSTTSSVSPGVVYKMLFKCYFENSGVFYNVVQVISPVCSIFQYGLVLVRYKSRFKRKCSPHLSSWSICQMEEVVQHF